MKKVRLQKKLMALAVSVVLLIGCVGFTASAEEPAAAQNMEQNPYVAKYLEERGPVDEDSLLNNSEQRAFDIQTLKEIYNEDIEVGQILEKYTPATRSSASIDLVSKATSLDKEQIIQTMHRIEDVYESAEDAEKEAMLSYLLHHARACEDPQAIAFLESLNHSEPLQTSANYSYNPGGAANYALTWWNSFNSSYPNMSDMGGDCTNFVSQCIRSGGVPMDSRWYCYKKNSTYLKPANGTQLYYSWSLYQPKSPWTSLAEFTSYWYPKTNVLQYSKQTYQIRHTDIYNTTSITIGDVVVLCSGVSGVLTIGEHAMIITYTDSANKDFKLAGHTNARKDYPLLTILSEQGYTAVDFYMF